VQGCISFPISVNYILIGELKIIMNEHYKAKIGQLAHRHRPYSSTQRSEQRFYCKVYAECTVENAKKTYVCEKKKFDI
jgi:hypothetical protein